MKQAMIDYTKKPKFDHFDTPDYAVKPLLRHIPDYWTIWEPTDTTGKSRIAAVLKKHGCKVVSTWKKRFDFLKDTPDFAFDCIVTNPPYSIKDEFIERCIAYEIEQKTKWALLMPLTALEGVKRGALFTRTDEFGLMVLDRRVEFTGGSVWFNTSWFTSGMFRGIEFAQLEKSV